MRQGSARAADGSPPAKAKISVAVPTRGRPIFLDECLRSIVRQTLSACEIVVSEDGEDAQTAGVIRRHIERGAPIRHTKNVPPLGQLGNRRRAFELTSGEFVAMLDDDDIWEDNFLAVTYAALQRSECAFCTTDHFIVDHHSQILSDESEAASLRFGRTAMSEATYEDVLLRHLVSKPFSLHTSLFARPVLASVGFFPDYAGVVPDFALFLELGAAGAAACYIPERLGRYRVHPGQQNRSRVETGESLISCLVGFHAQHPQISAPEQAAAARLYREATIELAIAYGHAGDRRRSLNALRGYGLFGWNWPNPRRLAVLAGLLAGARRIRPARIHA